MKRFLAAPILTVTIASLALTHAAADVTNAPNSPADVDDTFVASHYGTGDWNGGDEEFLEAYNAAFDVMGIMRFNNLPRINHERVTNATLRLYCNLTYPEGSVTSLQVFETPSDWDEFTITWNNWPMGYPYQGTPLLTVSDIIKDAWFECDITDTVKSWLRGSPNHGLFFEGAGGSGATDWLSSDYTDPTLRPQLLIGYRPDLPSLVVVR